MIIDSKGKLFGKVSIIDLIIIIVVVGILAGVAYKFTKSDTPTFLAKQDTLKVVFYVEEALDETAKAINKGNVVREFVQNASFGSILDISIDKSVIYAADAEGNYNRSTKEGYSSLKLTMEAKGIYKENETTTIDGSEFFIGSYITLRVGQTAVYGRIIEISRIN